MPWKEATVMSQKEEFVKLALSKTLSFSQLCSDFKISRETGYKLLKRYNAEGSNGFEPRSKAPKRSPAKTPARIEEKILTVRIKHPTWGARKIRAHLITQGIVNLPAPSTITDILKRNGCISDEESLKHQPYIRFERNKPNELWQMDFKGHFKLATRESCHPLTIIDDHSRFSICLKACKNEQLHSVKNQLILTFRQYGLPEQINVDNGNPWGNCKLLSHTRLTVWLLQLGVQVTHSRPRHPQTNGKNERFHRTLKKDVLSNQVINDLTHAQKLFDEWRDIYNHKRPHEAIGMLVPAKRYRPSLREMPEQLPPVEYNESAIVRKVHSSGIMAYRNKNYYIGEAFSNHNVEVRHNELLGQLNVYFGEHKIYTGDLD